MGKKIKAIFISFNKFESTFDKTFGNLNKQRIAKRKFMGLQQNKFALKYTAKFRQIAIHLLWDNKPLITQYYKKLKNKIKNKLAKTNRLNKFHKYMAIAVKIDNRLYKQKPKKIDKTTIAASNNNGAPGNKPI